MYQYDEINCYRPLILSVAKRYNYLYNAAFSFEDAVQEGYLAMLEAFDYSKEKKTEVKLVAKLFVMRNLSKKVRKNSSLHERVEYDSHDVRSDISTLHMDILSGIKKRKKQFYGSKSSYYRGLKELKKELEV